MKMFGWKIERVCYPKSRVYNKKLWSVMFRSPAGGWIDELEGLLITGFQAREFEAGKHIKSAVKGSDRKKIMVRVKRLNKHQLNQLGEFLDSISC